MHVAVASERLFVRSKRRGVVRLLQSVIFSKIIFLCEMVRKLTKNACGEKWKV